MKRQTVIIFYVLGIYVFLQFAWWGYHLIELTGELHKAPSETTKRTIMVLGEGLVFFSILLLGLWKIRYSIRKELQLAKNQNNFLLSVTHELKTPLASTRLLLQTLKKHGLDEEKRTSLVDKTLAENLRLESLIDNILNATRLEHNALVPTHEETNLSLFLNDITDAYQKRFPEALISREIDSDVLAQCDRFFIECILANLLDNAFKYAGDRAHILVELNSSKDTINISISDNGPGIPDTEKKEVFRKFYRSGNEETRSQKGSGLGLYIVSELVRLHQGTIVLSSGKQGGAKFEVILPI